MKLIVQGAMKMDEPEVMVRCRKADQKVVSGLLDKAAKEINKQRAQLQDLPPSEGQGIITTFDVVLKLDKGPDGTLPAKGPKASSGGVVLIARGGRITCDNTL